MLRLFCAGELFKATLGVLVIGLSVRQDKETEPAMRAAGVKGYLTKESAGQDLHQLVAQIIRMRETYC